MTNNDKLAFAAIMSRIATRYRHERIEMDDEIDFELLKEWSLPQINIAIQEHMKHPERGRFMPRPADLCLHLQKMPKDQKGAWNSVSGKFVRTLPTPKFQKGPESDKSASDYLAKLKEKIKRNSASTNGNQRG